MRSSHRPSPNSSSWSSAYLLRQRGVFIWSGPPIASSSEAAKLADAIVLTKDSDFLLYLDRHGPPPRVLWLRCGNTSNAHLKQLLKRVLPSALQLLEAGEVLVEIADAAGE